MTNIAPVSYRGYNYFWLQKWLDVGDKCYRGNKLVTYWDDDDRFDRFGDHHLLSVTIFGCTSGFKNELRVLSTVVMICRRNQESSLCRNMTL